MAGGFQTSVAYGPAPGLPGDFASHNPRWNVNAGPFGLVAGPAGLLPGRFAWISYAQIDGDGAPARANNFGQGLPAGLIGRNLEGTLTVYLQESGGIILPGMACTVFNGGDFWVQNDGATYAQVNMKAYASFADGKLSFAATGAAPSGTFTGSIAAGTGSVTGSITDNLMTVTAVGSGALVVGALLTGTNVVTGTRIISQVSGTTGGVGVYRVSIPGQSVASTTISATYGVLTVTAGSGVGVGQTLSGSGVTAGTTVTQLGTGTGGTGTYYVDTTQTAASTTVTGASGAETKWICASPGAPGEMVKVTSHTLG